MTADGPDDAAVPSAPVQSAPGLGAVVLGAVVLSGGSSRRMGGTDKTRADLAGATLLQRVIDSVPQPVTIVVVGPPRPLPPGVLVAREDPPGSGPAAGVLAGWRVLRASAETSAGAGRPLDVVLVLAGDGPFAGTALPRLVAALWPLRAQAAAAVGRDPTGTLQPLLAAFTPAALDHALHRAEGPAAGRAARSLLDGVDVVTVAVSDSEVADVDTPADLAAARRRAGDVLEERRRPDDGR